MVQHAADSRTITPTTNTRRRGIGEETKAGFVAISPWIIGFVIFIPFLIIDLVVSAVLMSMGMMMVPPTVVALPFKLAFFVVVDGWGLIAAALVRGYQP